MSPEREYVYEVGLTPDDKQRISQTLGVHCLSLEDYADVRNQINKIGSTQDGNQ